MRIENSFVLFPGIGEKTEKKLWKKGVTHWDDVEDSSVSRKDRILAEMDKARKNLNAGNSLYFKEKLPNKSLWRTYENFRDDVCFFDIETTGLDKKRNKVTTVSLHRGGETKTLVRGQDLTKERLEEEIFQSSVLVSFNGKRFDQPFLEHNYDMNIKKPHIDLMYPCKRLGFSGGLKKIEKELRIERDLEDIDGREAVKLWKKYEKNNNEDALDKLVRYNQYDTVNLQTLLEEVHQRMRKEVFEPHL